MTEETKVSTEHILAQYLTESEQARMNRLNRLLRYLKKFGKPRVYLPDGENSWSNKAYMELRKALSYDRHELFKLATGRMYDKYRK